jgi:lipid-binding SYLF domain-containing protein
MKAGLVSEVHSGNTPRKWGRMGPVVFCAMLASAISLGSDIAYAQGEQQKQEEVKKLTPEEKQAGREAGLATVEAGMAKLYEIAPEARATVEKSPGYAVFDVTGVYALVFVGQKGKGVLIDNETKKPTYMMSVRAGTGPGIGKQRVYQIFVFKSKGAMEQFVIAGGTGGDVSATASAGKEGFVRSFNPNIDIYQITISGNAVQASWGGTVYSVDTSLN